MTGVQIPPPAPHHNEASDLKEETESVLEALGIRSESQSLVAQCQVGSRRIVDVASNGLKLLLVRMFPLIFRT